MEINNLWVIMPVFNEENALKTVIEEWVFTFDQSKYNYTFCVYNDGSNDQSAEILDFYSRLYPRLKVITNSNCGHGQTCLLGYRLALQNGADWIFQIDSDGQCSPKHFTTFLEKSNQYPAVFGYRKTRDDGLSRWMISRVVSVFTLLATGSWIKDANVPYRLINSSLLIHSVDKIPNDFHLANILLTYFVNKQQKIHWINIHFRDRIGGSPSVKPFSYFKNGIRLFLQLKQSIRKIDSVDSY